VLAGFRASHDEMMRLVASLSGRQLLTPGCYSWTRKNALITYLGPNLASHYRWAIRHIRRWRKACGRG